MPANICAHAALAHTVCAELLSAWCASATATVSVAPTLGQHKGQRAISHINTGLECNRGPRTGAGAGGHRTRPQLRQARQVADGKKSKDLLDQHQFNLASLQHRIEDDIYTYIGNKLEMAAKRW